MESDAKKITNFNKRSGVGVKAAWSAPTPTPTPGSLPLLRATPTPTTIPQPCFLE